MLWANFLHLYQPADQQPDILQAIVTQSYQPLLQGFSRHKNIRLSLNVTGTLLELFDRYGHRDLLDILRRLAREGRIELTGSAKYHALLPFLPAEEITRQIRLNNEAMRYFIGAAYKPKGFFPPEMAYNSKVASAVAEAGFSWMMLDEIAYNGEIGTVDYNKTYTIKGTNLYTFFRERRPSNLIMSAVARTPKTLKDALHEDLKTDRYMITAMDGETFGHHRPGLELSLFSMLNAKGIKLANISDLIEKYPTTEVITPRVSTWASSQQDIEQGIQFLSWSDPSNPIHTLQWKLQRLVLHAARTMNKKHAQFKTIQSRMDTALASDHFWWASAKPWWSVEMIEDGAYRLLDVLRSIPRVPRASLRHAATYYEQIVSTAFQWQRSGRIRRMMQEQEGTLRIPFKDRTLGHGGAERGVYYAFVALMKKLETQAAHDGEYEKAILWRDAVRKFETKTDIYDAVNAIDLLRIELPHDEVEQTIAEYKARYRKIRGGQPEQRGA